MGFVASRPYPFVVSLSNHTAIPNGALFVPEPSRQAVAFDTLTTNGVSERARGERQPLVLIPSPP